MKINDLTTNAGDAVYYDENFHVVLESHLTYFRQLSTTKVFPLDPFMTYKYEGDFFGLLDALLIPKQFHWFMLRLNNYQSTGDFQHETVNILLPSFSEIDLIKVIFQTKKTSI